MVNLFGDLGCLGNSGIWSHYVRFGNHFLNFFGISLDGLNCIYSNKKE